MDSLNPTLPGQGFHELTKFEDHWFSRHVIESHAKLLSSEGSFVPPSKKDGFFLTVLNLEFCQRLGKTPMETLKTLSKEYCESTMAGFKVYEWHRCFKEGRESIEYNESVERPSISRNTENVALVSECVQKDRC
ncbi:hypothetical protein TNCV_4047021 [Trichonephila clavipes]|nr:hypothetical protein TNCV_4047021 [Trichonephila clavipes]